METLEKYTPIELNKMIHDVEKKHTTLKNEIIALVDERENIENKINEKLSKLESIELDYVKLMEELSSRN